MDSAQIVDAAFRRASVGMAITDASGVYLDVNHAFCDLLGYSIDELRGMSFSDVTMEVDAADGANALRRLADRRLSEFHLEKRYVTANHELLWARTTGIAVYDDEGKLARVIMQVEDLTMQRATEDALTQRESYDELTGLANRRLFYDRLRTQLSLPRAATRGASLLVVNLDRFSQFNAGLGHAATDEVLREVGRRLSSVARGQDTVSRLNGDEFAMLAPGVTKIDAVALAIQIRQALGEPYWADGNAVYVSARVGVVTATRDVDPETLVHRATAATEHAKALSVGWALHEEGAEVASREEHGLVSDLREAIDNGDLTVAYQPIVSRDGSIHCLEALARWNHPERGPVPPDVFIVVAEKNDLIDALTTRVLETVIGQAALWTSNGLAVPVAVNLSGKLLGHPDLVEGIRRLLAAAGVSGEMLTLEITETALATGGDEAIWSALTSLRSTGVRISIDDFGTGYSSLGYLKHLPVDELKIDRSFITDLATDPRAARIVRSIIDLAHSLDLTVVAEGVEGADVAAQLLHLGVDHLQGYLIARPSTGRATTDWLDSHAAVPLAPAGRAKQSLGLKVLVVDDEEAIRAELREHLHAHRHSVLEAGSGLSAVSELLRGEIPDVVVLDQTLPGLDGIATAPRLREAGYAGPIVLLSAAPPAELAAMRFPMDVWPVSKADSDTLMRLIDGYAGARPAQPAARASLGLAPGITTSEWGRDDVSVALARCELLSPRQRDVVQRLLEGERVPQIAASLYVSQSTVRNHLSQVFTHFQVHSQHALIKLLRAA